MVQDTIFATFGLMLIHLKLMVVVVVDMVAKHCCLCLLKNTDTSRGRETLVLISTSHNIGGRYDFSMVSLSSKRGVNECTSLLSV